MTTFEAPTDQHRPADAHVAMEATGRAHQGHATAPTSNPHAPGPELLFGFFGDEEDKLWMLKGLGIGAGILAFFTVLVWTMGLHLLPTVLGH